MTAALLFALVLVLLGALQVALALGAPLGRFVWGGQHDVLPTTLRIGSLVAVPIYALMGLVVLDRAGSTDVLPGGFVDIAMWVVVGYLVLAIAPNAISRSRSERLLMVPVTVALAALALVVALG